MKNRLTYRQMLFVNYYLLTLANGAQAARLAGYSEHSCRREATRLHNFIGVRIYARWYYSTLKVGVPRWFYINKLMKSLDENHVYYHKSDIKRITHNPPTLKFNDLNIHGKANHRLAKQLYGL